MLPVPPMRLKNDATVRSTQARERASAGDRIATLVHTQVPICALGAFFPAPSSSDN